jgi:NADH:ubiquinone oxidoreductase subunit 6 (subunit J)
MSSPSHTVSELQGWGRSFWHLFMTALCFSLAGCVLSMFAMFADSLDSIILLKIMVTAITVLFTSMMGLLTTCLANGTRQLKMTRLTYVLSLATLMIGTVTWIGVIWNTGEPTMPWQGFLTSFILFPTSLILLKMTGCPSRCSES